MSRRVPLWLAVPAMAGLAVFLVYPMVYLVALAVTKSSLAKPLRGFVGADNLTTAFASPAFTPSLVRSSVFAVVAAIVTTVLGLGIALLLRQRGSRFGVIGALFLLPLVTAPVLVGVAWKLLLAPVGGGLAGFFDAVGLPGLNPLGSGAGAFLVLLLIHIWQWTPFAVLIAFAALGVVRPELLESARIDGADSWRTFTTVIWPAIAPTMWAVVLLELVIGYKVFDLIVVVTAGGPGFSTALSPYVIYQTGLRGSFDMGTAAAQTLVFGLVVGAVATIVTTLRTRALKGDG
ncbi:carbohydrate ABC transporter permease [Mycolicibacterium goodii]|uniref:Sugar ABC transporter permease n=1 Tax=Mycolicibacterium goodii TaxID=134601 RepID=A0ABS6HSP7_MYCGD|nr:sugar ABC transporter permease [Mycolicibacterium goodii]MBU8808145.1 sugar ABC transporter permease [Mycolicibacterium goodii]MBU8825719.1 sugar ABC transporter permease [Mycolicibacterium goodii]MBU8829869.1 sugar ABC transporter permease [Mycolicibacterium goodii]MBU8839950.1 sugar ABC transporter permease [Mycolicibacterium goodii]ULN48334.1 sugar ABC transporter permease [Mycolicibacterium goodii]